MNRKLKALGLALVAALALTAVMASVASAQFTSNKTHTILSGSQKTGTNGVFTAGSGFGGISCENATFNGTAQNTSEPTLVVHPVYSNCKDSFGRTVHVDNSTLVYTFTSGAGKGTVHTSGGMTMTVTSGGSVVCTIVWDNPQTNNGVTYTNLGGTSGVEITIHATNWRSITSGGFFNCGIPNGTHTSGAYDDVLIVTGKDTAGAAASPSVD
jgi:hypothetical protein